MMEQPTKLSVEQLQEWRTICKAWLVDGSISDPPEFSTRDVSQLLAHIDAVERERDDLQTEIEIHRCAPKAFTVRAVADFRDRLVAAVREKSKWAEIRDVAAFITNFPLAAEEDESEETMSEQEVKARAKILAEAVMLRRTMKTDNPSIHLLIDLAECERGKGLPVSPRAKGYRYCMAQGWIERLGVPSILEVTRITEKGRKFLKEFTSGAKENK